MLSKFLRPGDRIELQMVEHHKKDEESQRVFVSEIHEILSEDQMEIVMPMEKTKLILLPVDVEYDLTIYAQHGLFQCFARVIDRYKSNNVYILVVELTTNLRKHQRREYYRYSCALDMSSRELEENEIKAVELKEPFLMTPGLPIKRSVIVDISGGGLRFVSEQKYEPESLIYCSYSLLQNGMKKQYEIVGKVLTVTELSNRRGSYEHRVQYVDLDKEVREEIIRFIFEEERKNRKKERYNDK
ncbi:MAG: flagellar brake protein [Lachnospiraceae bacterium]|nr:flagellar brake protein [Lachnospiraceae bacterium]